MSESDLPGYDCVVVGSGNAGSCAALSAKKSGCDKVIIVDKAPPEWAGGNSYFTAGAFRVVHGGLPTLLPLVKNVTNDQARTIDLEPYTADQFTGDIMRLSRDQSDATMVKALVNSSQDAVKWLYQEVGVNFVLSFNRQAYETNGRQKFWGGMALGVQDGGKGLIRSLHDALLGFNVEISYGTEAVELMVDNNTAVGVVVKKDGVLRTLKTRSVILAAGGYESSASLRTKHLGEAWANARVRGTPYNTGECFQMAQSAGSKLTGDWKGCHSTCWDANAPADAGDRERTNQFTKSGYPLGIMVNSLGHRFVDEGADFRNFTYAKYGREILHQPGGVAWQIWDSTMTSYLRVEEYGDGVVEKVKATSIEEFAEKIGVDKRVLTGTVEAYNKAVHCHRSQNPGASWDPAIKDDLSTQSTLYSLEIPKSNWATPIEQPPFLAVKVSCGITFTFGGLAIDPVTASVLSEASGRPIKGLFCCGEMVGGLFYDNYPGGSGLTSGTVFGIKAGRSAANLALQR